MSSTRKSVVNLCFITISSGGISISHLMVSAILLLLDFFQKKRSFSDPRGAQVFGLVNTFVSGHRANCRLRVVINYRMAKSRENDTLAGGNVHRRSGPKKTRGGGRRKSHRLARNKQKKSPKTKFPRSRPIIKSLFKDNEKKKKTREKWRLHFRA